MKFQSATLTEKKGVVGDVFSDDKGEVAIFRHGFDAA